MTDTSGAVASSGAARGGGVLVGALVIDSLGNGLFLPLSLVFFLKLTAVPLAALGVLASAATVITLPVPAWTGTLADKVGALPLVIASQLMQAAGYLAYSWVKTPAWIFAASSLVAIGVRVFWSAVFTAIADYADASPGKRTKDSWYALANTARTAGLAVGGLIAGAAVAGGRDAAYLAIAYGASASFATAATVIALFVRVPPARDHGTLSRQGYKMMLSDRPFLALIAVNTVFALSSLMLPTALPAFALRGLHTPGWLTASILAGNAVLISALSAPVTRRRYHRGGRRVEISTAMRHEPSGSRRQMVASHTATTAPPSPGISTVTVHRAYPRSPQDDDSSSLMVRRAPPATARSMAVRQNSLIVACPLGGSRPRRTIVHTRCRHGVLHCRHGPEHPDHRAFLRDWGSGAVRVRHSKYLDRRRRLRNRQGCHQPAESLGCGLRGARILQAHNQVGPLGGGG